VTWIGEKVQSTLASYPVVSSAVLDDRNGLVRFSLAVDESAGAVTGAGVDLVFDLTVGAWVSVDQKTGATATQASQDAAMLYVDGAWRYSWLSTDGTVYYERATSDANAYLDGSSWVTMKAITPWIHVAGLQGEQFVDQVLFLARKLTGHDLTLSLAFDYVNTYTETKTFSAATIASLGRQWLIKGLTQTTSNAIRVKVEDATPSSGIVDTGQGSRWVGLTISGQPHAKVKRSTGTQRGGS
jgi:hypothetical protein